MHISRSISGYEVRGTNAVIRFASDQLMLHSPCEITPTIAEATSALGHVAHIVAPGNFHNMYTATAQAAFPQAKTSICPGVERRNPSLKYDGVLDDGAPEEWLGEIDQVLVQGTRIMREVAMFHRPSRTLLLVDLIENFTDATPHIGGMLKFWFKYVLRMWNSPRPAPEYRMGWIDHQAAAKSLRRILAWDFQRIVLAHGDLIDRNAREVAAAAWSGLLER